MKRKSVEIWNHFDGYQKSRQEVLQQSLEDDLTLIDALYGRDNLRYGASPDEVKDEALRQHEIDWRNERNERAEFYVNVARAQLKT